MAALERSVYEKNPHACPGCGEVAEEMAIVPPNIRGRVIKLDLKHVWDRRRKNKKNRRDSFLGSIPLPQPHTKCQFKGFWS
jgi:hypothetical protein